MKNCVLIALDAGFKLQKLLPLFNTGTPTELDELNAVKLRSKIAGNFLLAKCFTKVRLDKKVLKKCKHMANNKLLFMLLRINNFDKSKILQSNFSAAPGGFI